MMFTTRAARVVLFSVVSVCSLSVWKHQYGMLYGPACIRLMILRFLNWSPQIWMTSYLQKFGTILTTFSTNFYLIKLITITIFDHVLILFH